MLGLGWVCLNGLEVADLRGLGQRRVARLCGGLRFSTWSYGLEGWELACHRLELGSRAQSSIERFEPCNRDGSLLFFFFLGLRFFFLVFLVDQVLESLRVRNWHVE